MTWKRKVATITMFSSLRVERMLKRSGKWGGKIARLIHLKATDGLRCQVKSYAGKKGRKRFLSSLLQSQEEVLKSF